MTIPDMGFFDLEAVMLAGAADITAMLPVPEVFCIWLPSQ